MKALITGSKAFIGSHLSAGLEANRYEVIKCDLKNLEDDWHGKV